MNDDPSRRVSLPLDSDGFLRRECPNCERELKWRPTPEGEQGYPMPEGGYHCPYCDRRANEDSWWTKAQVAHVDQVAADLADPVIQQAAEEIGGTYEPAGPRDLTPLSPEPDDMRRVDFECHPVEPVKVLDDWTEPVHCIICGQTA
jgi:hypothetical protein